jgi:F-type H+-transporting ATPase subunit c
VRLAPRRPARREKPAVTDNDKEFAQMSTHLVALTPVASSLTDAGRSGLKSRAIGVGGGLGAVGAGIGIGLIFKGVIESVTRQPELRAEITQIQWSGFALTQPGRPLLWPGRRSDRLHPLSAVPPGP